MEADNRKSKIAAGLFGIFLGSLGIHNFYLGYTNRGITQLIMTLGGYVFSTILWTIAGILSIFLVGFLLMPFAFIMSLVPVGAWVWGLIEGIMLLCGNINTDASGNTLKD